MDDRNRALWKNKISKALDKPTEIGESSRKQDNFWS